MKQYNCVFLRLSLPVHLPDFICPNSNIKFKVKFFFLLFQKLMWTILAVNGISPLVLFHMLWTQNREVPKKKKLNKKDPGVAGRWSVMIMRPHLSLCPIFCTNDLTCIIVKTWEKYIFSLSSLSLDPCWLSSVHYWWTYCRPDRECDLTSSYRCWLGSPRPLYMSAFWPTPAIVCRLGSLIHWSLS